MPGAIFSGDSNGVIRAYAAVDGRILWEMATEIGDERIAIVSHGTFMDSLIKTILGRLPGNELHFSHYNTGITRIDYTQSWQDKTPLVLVRYTNRVDHLTPELIT